MPWLNSAPPPTQRFHSSSRRPGTNRSLLVKQRRRLYKKSTAMRRSEQGTIGSIEGDNDVATSCTSGCATRFGVPAQPYWVGDVRAEGTRLSLGRSRARRLGEVRQELERLHERAQLRRSALEIEDGSTRATCQIGLRGNSGS